MYNTLNQILNKLMSGDLSCLNPNNIGLVSKITVDLLEKEEFDEQDLSVASIIISISQIVYNNTDRSVLFLDDGVYDLLLEKYKLYEKNFMVGAPVIKFNQDGEATKSQEPIQAMKFIDNADEFIATSLFYEDLSRVPRLDYRLYDKPLDIGSGKIISKKNIKVPHMYPKLVGSLDKCKFTLNKEAIERDIFENENVKIFERDFLARHLQMGLIDMTTPFELVAELKYDGVSVEADVTNKILSARSRGDANEDIAEDLTDILGGYEFPYAPEIPENEAFGMKFEAIMTYNNLSKMSALRGKAYKNSRNGIIGLLGSADAYDYRNLITLIPLATSIEDIDRVTEIEFLNKYYHSGEYLRYSVLRGTYVEILYQVYKFVKEAEVLRTIMPFMYDGVVISYRDPKIIKALGRENSINKYSMAIKFNPLVREAIFLGYTYTVGQDGIITPMIHYTPVEFYGTIHTKSSGHSYKRFMDLELAKGDIIQIEYTNDVMPYVTKPEVTNNFSNPNPPEVFPTKCPICGADVVVNKSGKSAICPNYNCSERVIARMANMMDKLNLKDFGEETFRFLGTTSISQLLNYTLNDVKELGPTTSEKLMERIEEIKRTPIFDYKIIGSIGFTGIAIETWKKVFSVISINDIINDSNDVLRTKLVSIRGIGPISADTIVYERHIFMNDIITITTMLTVMPSIGLKEGKHIRFTGCRPTEELYNYLSSKGCDARPDAGVTRSTDILIVPYIGFSSSKTSKVGDNTLIIDMAEFVANVDKYIL